MDEPKTCHRCRIARPRDDFGNDGRRPDGKQSTCRACQNGRRRDRYADDPVVRDRMMRQSREGWARHKDRFNAGRRDRLRSDAAYRQRVNARQNARRQDNSAALPPDAPKTCASCGVAKHARDFHHDRRRRDGRFPYCARCACEYQRRRRPPRERARQSREEVLARIYAWRAANPAKVRQYARAWWRRNPDKLRDRAQRRRAWRQGVPASAVERRVVFDRDRGICRFCGQPVDPENWHLDHVIPLSKGGAHSYDNVAVSHPRCNIRAGNRER